VPPTLRRTSPISSPRAAVASAPPSSPGGPEPDLVERELDRVAAEIQRFRVDVQRFFGGDLKHPPDDRRDRIQADLRRLRTSNLRGAAVHFRLQTLEAQLTAQLELYGRRLRQQEEGASRRSAAEAAPPLDAREGVTISEKPDAAAVAALYKGLYQAGDHAPSMDLDRFRGYLAQQVETIRSKTGCREIVFRVAEEEGKLKLKARPVKAG
jgi:hypothetical protein